jgi:hypothetical protein
MEVTSQKLALVRLERSLAIERPAPHLAFGQTGRMEKSTEVPTYIEFSRLARTLDMRDKLSAAESQLDFNGPGK